MVIAIPPGFSGSEPSDRQLPSLSWIPSVRERSGSHSSGRFERRGRVPVLRLPPSRTPSPLGWRPIRGCARDVRASSRWWFAYFYYHMHAHAHHRMARSSGPRRDASPKNSSDMRGSVYNRYGPTELNQKLYKQSDRKSTRLNSSHLG